ncbi:MAG: ABC transporter ATP-binding protein [Candidatus Moranbacteria bacterium]|jgi:putative ABC transport system ATP-binding protein|nr:ABC transporter ATP-binding protein [Candidatus Moranbacteria bacterium]
MPLILTKNLSKIYDNEGVKTPAVCGVSFSIDKGEFVAIMGPSGSGKSTLMQLLGFLDRPTGGKYFFESRDSEDFSDDELADIRNKKIGFIFQTFNLLPRTTVFENVELPLLYSNQNFNQKQIREKIKSALVSVSMDHRIDHFSNQLSGGEKQRVAIARALVNNPEIIFADEPTGNLDSKSGIQIMKILQKLNDEGKTIILVTHETFTAKHAKRMIRIVDGKIVEDSPIEDRRIAADDEILK